LKPDYLKDPRVSVEVLNYRPFYIIGEVKKPGSYAYVSGMTVVNAIALAGGYTYRARENKFLVTRATDPKNIKHPADHDTQVLPGDVIEVPERFF
jgi:protein involved in polysaccharide export with SLBB domain